jgi:hypothetical protein
MEVCRKNGMPKGRKKPTTHGPKEARPVQPTESKEQEHHRLQERTDELQAEHEALSPAKKPFSKTEHDEHSADLAQHKTDLAGHRKRPKS